MMPRFMLLSFVASVAVGAALLAGQDVAGLPPPTSPLGDALALPTSQATVAAPPYVVTDLGTLPGANECQVRALNDRGQVVGQSGDQAFLWENGRMRVLPPLPGYTLQPRAINNRKQVTGVAWGAVSADIDRQRRAFVWDERGGTRDLGTPEGEITEAFNINDAGQVVGTSFALEMRGGQMRQVRKRAFVWTPGAGFRSLDAASAGGFLVSPAALDERGRVVGCWCGGEPPEAVGITSPRQIPDTDGAFPLRAFVWDPISSLRQRGEWVRPFLPGAWGSSALSINTTGTVLGSLTRYENQQATKSVYLWQNGRVTERGGLGLPGPISLRGARLNARGEFAGTYEESVVYAAEYVGQRQHAFVYRNGRALLLDKWLPALRDWKLREVIGVNERGQLLVNGVRNEINRALLLTPRRTP